MRAVFGYFECHASISAEACCPTLEACGWAATGCECNATLHLPPGFVGSFCPELPPPHITMLPKANVRCPDPNTTHHGGYPRRHEREGGPVCLDQHDCDSMEYEET